MVKIYAELTGDSEKFRIKSLSDNKNDVNFGTRYQSSQPFFSDMWEEITEDIQDPLQEAIEGVLK